MRFRNTQVFSTPVYPTKEQIANMPWPEKSPFMAAFEAAQYKEEVKRQMDMHREEIERSIGPFASEAQRRREERLRALGELHKSGLVDLKDIRESEIAGIKYFVSADGDVKIVTPESHMHIRKM